MTRGDVGWQWRHRAPKLIASYLLRGIMHHTRNAKILDITNWFRYVACQNVIGRVYCFRNCIIWATYKTISVLDHLDLVRT